MPASLRIRAIHLRRRGFTILELVVVVGVLCVVVSLLLPAVQAAREAARRAQCTNHLHQIILAAHEFESSHGGFPCVGSATLPAHPYKVNMSSTQSALLPYLEHRAIFDAINFSTMCCSLDEMGIRGNATAARQAVGVFLCPSDPLASAREPAYAPNSYRANTGLGELRYRPDRDAWMDVPSGAFDPVRAIMPLGEFQDGLSNTLAFSEKPVGSGLAGTYHPFRDWIENSFVASTADGWIAACSRPRRPLVLMTDSGATWLISNQVYTYFYVKQPPNGPVPDCGGYGVSGQGLFTARSYHPGGVNAALADGSVRFFGNGIDVKTWRALGTRAGSD